MDKNGLEKMYLSMLKQQVLQSLMSNPLKAEFGPIRSCAKTLQEKLNEAFKKGRIDTEFQKRVQDEFHRINFALGLALSRHQELKRQLAVVFKDPNEVPKPLLEMINKDKKLPSEETVSKIIAHLMEPKETRPSNSGVNATTTKVDQNECSNDTVSSLERLLQEKLRNILQREKLRNKKSRTRTARRKTCSRSLAVKTTKDSRTT